MALDVPRPPVSHRANATTLSFRRRHHVAASCDIIGVSRFEASCTCRWRAHGEPPVAASQTRLLGTETLSVSRVRDAGPRGARGAPIAPRCSGRANEPPQSSDLTPPRAGILGSGHQNAAGPHQAEPRLSRGSDPALDVGQTGAAACPDARPAEGDRCLLGACGVPTGAPGPLCHRAGGRSAGPGFGDVGSGRAPVPAALPSWRITVTCLNIAF